MNIYIKKGFLIRLLNDMVAAVEFDVCPSGIMFIDTSKIIACADKIRLNDLEDIIEKCITVSAMNILKEYNCIDDLSLH